jgi:hypothetical protein
MRKDIEAKVFLAAAWPMCVYRAATQSIAHDEALTYQLYLAGSASQNVPGVRCEPSLPRHLSDYVQRLQGPSDPKN